MSQMCLSCSERPATSGSGTVPLCSECAGQQSNPRGVEFVSPTVLPEEAIQAMVEESEALGLYN